MKVISGGRFFTHGRLILAGYLLIIAMGTLLLSLPAASRNISVTDALFTSTSAVCVTGLIVKSTPVDFTPFGQTVILALIQIGGLGYMDFFTLKPCSLARRSD